MNTRIDTKCTICVFIKHMFLVLWVKLVLIFLDLMSKLVVYFFNTIFQVNINNHPVLEEELHADLCDLHFENPEISREKEVF